MRYCGVVTDKSWHEALEKLNTLERSKVIRKQVSKLIKLEEGMNFIYSVNRQPRVFIDEYK